MLNAAPPHLVDHGQAVALRQHHIDDGDVVGVLPGAIERRVAVGGMIDGESGLAQAARDEIGNRRVVFDDQRAHVGIIPLRPDSFAMPANHEDTKVTKKMP